MAQPGNRPPRSRWEMVWRMWRTQYTGNIKDAHNVISLGLDGDGYLHMSWDHHNHPLRYVRSTAARSLDLGEKMTMTGKFEKKAD